MAQLTYVPRIETVVAYDWEYTAFTFDSTWRVLDLSAVVPENAVAVQIRWTMQRSAAYRYWKIRATGQDNAVLVFVLLGAIANVLAWNNPLVPLDAARTFEYHSESTNWVSGGIAVLGWFLYE